MRCPRCFRKLAAGARCPADGSQPVDDTAEARAAGAAPAPPSLADLVIDRLIASGGQASVWRATVDGRSIALKIPHVGGPEVAAALGREANALAAIGSPAVPSLYRQGTLADGRPYLAMELLAGATLGDVLAAAPGPLPLDEVAGWLRGLATAVAAIHAAGWVHCDLKPDNIVRDPDGRIRVLDLGLAVTAVSARAVVAGTALYMAPEQLRGEPITAATDLYALGAIGFELATTRPPFVGDRATIELGHQNFRAPRASTLRPMPAVLDEVLARCLAKAPADRPSSASSIAADLDAIDLGATVTRAAPTAVSNRSSVALVAVERAPSTHNLDVEARRRGGQVARHAGGRTVLAFVPDECPAPMPAALATAAALVAVDARVVVHVAQLVTRRGKDGRTQLFGAALDRPDWIPTTRSAGIVLTAAAARELDPSRVEAIDGGWRIGARTEDDPAARPVSEALLGNEALVASALASARPALREGPPAVWLAIGGAGAGKSRLLDELAAAIAAAEPEVAVIRLAGARSFGAGAGAALASLREQLDPIAPAAASSTPVPLTVEVRGALDAALAVGPLAILVDDAHWIDDAVMTALGVAARASTQPLWLAATATTALTDAAPSWLDGARVTCETLAPLDDGDARVLLRRALAPARRVPEALVARLAARCGGVPGVIVALARELRRAGVLRRHPGSDVWFVAADELDFLPPTPGVQWFATRSLIGLGPGVAELARAVALLRGDFTAGEVEAISRCPEAGVTIEPAIGLAELCHRGLVVADGDRYRFRSEAEQIAIADTVAAATQRAIHGAALVHAQQAEDEQAAARIAFHAVGAGDADTAAAAAERLAVAARARHAPLEAERWLTLAIDQLGDRDPAVRQRLLGARGATRRLLTHYEDAQADLRAARAIAIQRGDRYAEIELAVDDGAVWDFSWRFGESARLIEDAAARAPQDLPPLIRARVDNWLGVVRVRQERLPEARDLLTTAIATATALGDHQTAIGSMLMLGGVLRRLALPTEGLGVLDRAIALCDEVGDHFHLTYGLFNRVNVWRQLRRDVEAAADAERAIAVANHMGLDLIELRGWYDLSLLRFWAGDLPGALDAAAASHRIGSERLRDAPPVVTSLWYALLLAAAGELDAAERELGFVRADDVDGNPFLALTRDLAVLACDGALGPGWAGVIEQIDRANADPEDAVLVWWMHARTARRLGDRATAALAASNAAAAAHALGRAPVPLVWPGEEWPADP